MTFGRKEKKHDDFGLNLGGFEAKAEHSSRAFHDGGGFALHFGGFGQIGGWGSDPDDDQGGWF